MADTQNRSPDKVDKSAINTPVDLIQSTSINQKIRRQNPHLPRLNGTQRRQKLRPQIPSNRHPGHRRQHRGSTPNQPRRRQSHHWWRTLEPHRRRLKTSHRQKRHSHGAVEAARLEARLRLRLRRTHIQKTTTPSS